MELSAVRIDKWLWSTRIFKSRTLATAMCKSGRVNINATRCKPSSQVRINDLVSVQKNGYQFSFRVLQLLEKRVSAPIAQKTYKDLTPPEELNKYADWFVGKGSAEKRMPGAGRPTKRERRDLDSFKQDFYFADE